MPPEDNGWDQWKLRVLGELADNKKLSAQTAKELTNLRIAFEGFSQGMSVKAGVWGALAGLLPAVGVLLVMVLKG